MSKTTADRLQALDVNTLHRRAHFWQGAGLHFVLTYRLVKQDGQEEDVSETVFFSWTRCNYGGFRPWFLCPNCQRRVGKLYLAGKYYLCRHCHNLAYATQQEPARYRTLYKTQKIRMRLGGSGNISEPFPWKPRHMHWKTYEKLRLQSERAEMCFLGQLDAWMRGRGWL